MHGTGAHVDTNCMQHFEPTLLILLSAETCYDTGFSKLHLLTWLHQGLPVQQPLAQHSSKQQSCMLTLQTLTVCCGAGCAGMDAGCHVLQEAEVAPIITGVTHMHMAHQQGSTTQQQQQQKQQ